MRLNDILVQSSQAALALQLADGSFPAGRNGPYDDRETPVRNTAHWLITLLCAYSLTNDPSFKDAAWRAANYLTTSHVRPMGATFLCRTKPERDFCNGLIGQAWTIEALSVAADKLDEPKYLELARTVFLLHPYDQKAGLWRAVNVEGSYGPFDMTFNHQLWFATSGALIAQDGDDRLGAQVKHFLDRTLASHLKVDPSGRISHFVPSPARRGFVRKSLSTMLQPIRRLRRKPHMVHKEIGYHAFNLYAFAVLKQCLPAHPLWKSDKLMAALQFVNTPEYVHGLEQNKFGFPYNPPGFEVALAMQVFGDRYKGVDRNDAWWVSQQLRRTYDPRTQMISQQTEDPATLAARLYEATRLQDVEVQLG